MEVSRLTGGHTSPVLCVDVSSLTGTIASGSEKGDLCLWSSACELIHKYSRTDTDCTSVLFSREKPNTLYAAFGSEVLVFDTENPQEPSFVFQSNQDEVSQIVLDDKEQFLAACDDCGEIKVFGLSDNKVFKTLRFKHTNICSTVIFRGKNRPWELLSGGMDFRLIHWDFSKAKCLNQFNMQELHSTTSDASAYMVNPPFIHHLAKNREGTVTVCGLENGLVAVFDSSSKHLQEKFCLHAHQQAVSQLHFTSDTVLVSAGNDAKILVWDLSKAEQHHGNVVANGGDTSAEDLRNESVTDACRVGGIQHPVKVNWLTPFAKGEDRYVVVADHTCDLTVYPLSW
ncbi:hypothetical protein ACOMHN_039606 [Nucella lapillus]